MGVDYVLVFKTIKEDIPELAEQIDLILNKYNNN